jgi:hypothetical protein
MLFVDSLRRRSMRTLQAQIMDVDACEHMLSDWIRLKLSLIHHVRFDYACQPSLCYCVGTSPHDVSRLRRAEHSEDAERPRSANSLYRVVLGPRQVPPHAPLARSMRPGHMCGEFVRTTGRRRCSMMVMISEFGGTFDYTNNCLFNTTGLVGSAALAYPCSEFESLQVPAACDGASITGIVTSSSWRSPCFMLVPSWQGPQDGPGSWSLALTVRVAGSL